ncbi:hypothetical protein GobsT_28700 [Gemmata obscuriglobus]|uniref:Uncharacterized protein n=2 Tax=Gemmata obscuriglobus TaxID=114 RepID=A0A2Z3H224_9BACT|nr:hypothetical protein C1280_19195 [Gemmata obscuriglobus]QEG28097.1 hypothetical protein GobsT_28700 [Gemmata obscuriglobus]VTS05727.1 unnamed protein product [Gemmata obscuriglobus UQM 2246]
MGVPAELLGRQVRCPHCKQVVVAPATAGAAPEIVPPPPPPPAPVPPPEPELRSFDLPVQKEEADSILSDPHESEDEVFGSSTASRLRTLTREPAPEPVAPAPARPINAGPAPVAGGSAPAHPFSSSLPLPNLPAPVKAPLPQPVAKPTALAPADDPKPAPPPAPAAPPSPPKSTPAPPPAPALDNPFALLSAIQSAAKTPALAPAVEERLETGEDEPAQTKKRKERDEEPEERPMRATSGRAGGGAGGAKTVLLVVLAGYAFIATVAAVYGLFFRSGTPAGHPLSTIPDTFGEFDPVSRKKVTQATFPVDGPLPPELRAGLGNTISIGQLEVQPTKVEKRKLAIRVAGTDDREAERTMYPGPALVMTLDIKNTSPDLPILPMDPAFTRREAASDQPITRLVTSKRAFYGGEIEWPWPKGVKRKIEVQQGNDAIPLRPGESREYVVFTAAGADLIRTAEAEKGPLQWRVQLRRGLIEYKGKEVPVTAVIGVDFQAADIRTPD